MNLSETSPVTEPQSQEQQSPREFAPDFTDEELEQLEQLVDLLTTAESTQTEKAPTWDELSRDQQNLLIKRYGVPRKISRQIRVVDYTKGEGCADNERALPSDFDTDNNFGVWDKNLLVFALYGSAPRIELSTKVRIVPTGLVIGGNGVILIPDFFYTPSEAKRRELLINQINQNPRGDKSLRLAEEYLYGVLDTDALMVTVYRRVGTRMRAGDQFRDATVGKQAMDDINLPYVGDEDRLVRYRQTIEVSQKVQQRIAEIVTKSNLLHIKEAFKTGEVMPMKVKPGTILVHYIDIVIGEGRFMIWRDLEKMKPRFSAVKDPTWQFGDASRPLVYKIEYEVDGIPQEKYCFISNGEVMEKVET